MGNAQATDLIKVERGSEFYNIEVQNLRSLLDGDLIEVDATKGVVRKC